MKKKTIIITMLFFCLIYNSLADNKNMLLNDKTIIIDAGHGGKDVGTSFKDIYEKDINLKISLELKNQLEKKGASVYLTRSGDYDLSKPNAKRRKKSDFDNRILLINNSKSDLYISIHLNYFNDSKYKGAQVFYNNLLKENKEIAKIMQKNLNKERKIKLLDSKLYMYNKLTKPGILIECGFLSNYQDRKNLQNEKYIIEHCKKITKAIIEFYT